MSLSGVPGTDGTFVQYSAPTRSMSASSQLSPASTHSRHGSALQPHECLPVLAGVTVTTVDRGEGRTGTPRATTLRRCPRAQHSSTTSATCATKTSGSSWMASTSPSAATSSRPRAEGDVRVPACGVQWSCNTLGGSRWLSLCARQLGKVEDEQKRMPPACAVQQSPMP